jgi:release factor glutamine methyltransferase
LTQLRASNKQPDAEGAASGQGTGAWNVLKLLGWMTEFFKQKGLEPARRQAEDLIGAVLELDRLHLYLQFEYVPTPAELARLRDFVQRRGNGEPLAYLVGEQSFAGLKLKVDRRALIPRPETETLAERLIKEFSSRGGLLAADLGTGSGCLALAMAKRLGARVWATDLSSEALSLARENAENLGLGSQVEFLQGPFLEALKGRLPLLDLVVSNPPYIAEEERAGLPKDVVDFEPAQALFAGPDGLRDLTEILAEAPAFLKPGGLLALECGLGQPEKLKEAQQGSWKEVWTEKDGFGVVRFLFCRKAD